jgi:hypothetical protein
MDGESFRIGLVIGILLVWLHVIVQILPLITNSRGVSVLDRF